MTDSKISDDVSIVSSVDEPLTDEDDVYSTKNSKRN